MANQTPLKLHLIEPRATEKAYFAQAHRTYIFEFGRDFSKQAVAELVAKEFNVTVTDVRILIRKGKKTRYSKGKHAYPGTTYRKDKKLAYVTLKEGDSIKVFEDSESETTDAAKKRKAPQSEDSKEAKKAKKITAKTAKAEKDGGKETK